MLNPFEELFVNKFVLLRFLADFCKMDSSILKGVKSYRVIGYWFFAIVGGVVLIYAETLEAVDIEPMFSISTFIYFCLLFYWGIQWVSRQVKSNLKQRKENISLELKYLQSQINPHFLFNALNNLYGIVDKDSKQAKSFVLKLSELMRYSVYEGQQERVTIEQEVAYLKNYIYLHEIRYKKKLDIRFEENVESDKIEILPLLFITILENAFKHGVENLRANAYVHIKLIALSDAVYFEVVNNFDPEELNDSPGEGLNSLQKRLKLAYPKKHSYSIIKNENVYKAHLKIQLK